MYKYSIPPRFQLITIDYVIFFVFKRNALFHYSSSIFLLFNELFFLHICYYSSFLIVPFIHVLYTYIRSLTINVHLWTKSSTQFHKIIISFSLVFISKYIQKLLKRIKIFSLPKRDVYTFIFSIHLTT